LQRIAPNVSLRMMAWRPIIADPPIYSVADVRRLSLAEMMDANEALDLRAELIRLARERAMSEAKGRRT
jgi:hypothetical protein